MAALLLVLTSSVMAQTAGKVARIALFHVGSDHVPPSLDGLLEGLTAMGYDVGASRVPRESAVLKGRNVRIDWRNVADEEAAKSAARQFVADRVDLIVAVESQAARAAKAATSTIPVIFLHLSDALGEGFVGSLSRPGGNFTGVGEFRGELLAKRLEILTEMIPELRRVLVLLDSDDSVSRRELTELRKAAVSRRVDLVERELRDRAGIETVIRAAGRGEVEGLFLLGKLVTLFLRDVIPVASKRRFAVATHHRTWAQEGALFSYGPDYRAAGREAARYVDRILKGARPADLPVEQATKLELVINMKTAKALGLTIRPWLLMRADQVVE
jgi:putative ABC transport system substrate-binding protein